MQNINSINDIVKEKYGQIAAQSSNNCGCSSGCCDEAVDYSVLSEDYSEIDGYVEAADLGLGCGLPTEHAGISVGQTVIDLGSGAGNDVFIARKIVGPTGRVIGVDMTPEMIEKAEQNNARLGFENVEFHLGEIESLPVKANAADVVVSNCVLNLVPDKEKAFSEIFRILKPGGHFCISDIVLNGELPQSVKQQAELYVGCVSGAMQENDYLDTIRRAGFRHIAVKVKQATEIPDNLLSTALSAGEIEELKGSQAGIFSITVVAYK